MQALPAFGAVAIVLHTNDAARYQIVTGEVLFVNKKDEIRVSPEGPPAPLAPNQLGKLRAQPLRGNYILRKFADGTFQLKLGADSSWTAVIPEGDTEKTPVSPADFWKRAELSAGKEKQPKLATGVDTSKVLLAISAPSAGEALDQLVWAPDATGIPGRTEPQVLTERLAFLVSAARAYPAEATVDAWRGRIAGMIQGLLGDWSRGGASSAVLDLAGLWLNAAVQAFPADATLKNQVRKLADERASLLKYRTLLSALAAGEQHDPLLLSYADFEPYHRSFPDLQTVRRDAYRKSAQAHFTLGKALFDLGDFSYAREELALAARRAPALGGLDPLTEESRLAWARQKIAENSRIPKGDPMARVHVEANRHVQSAERLIGAGQLDQAETELAAAAAQEPSNIAVALIRARISYARHAYRRALAQLEEYDTHAATVDEFNVAEKLRNDVMFDLKDSKEKAHPQFDALVKAYRFQAAFKAANALLFQDPDDGEALFAGGIAAAVTRNPQIARDLLRRFLIVSDSEAGSAERRMLAIQLSRSLGTPAAPPPARGAARSWASGLPLEAGAVYCPSTLMFLPQVSNVRASRKLSTSYEWKEGKLMAVRNRMEDNTAPGAPQILFAYGSDGALIRLGKEPLPAKLEIPDDRWLHADQGWLTLWKAPELDPEMARMVAGTDLNIGVSGNAYFHPFSWDGLHMFKLQYDAAGRVREAVEIGGAGTLVFEWKGAQLTAVRKFMPDNRKEAAYTRTISYNGSRIAAEAISFGGKTGRITYKYDKAGKLEEADCDDDMSLDGRSRKVMFQ